MRDQESVCETSTRHDQSTPGPETLTSIVTLCRLFYSSCHLVPCFRSGHQPRGSGCAHTHISHTHKKGSQSLTHSHIRLTFRERHVPEALICLFLHFFLSHSRQSQQSSSPVFLAAG